jgi:hypothetical protein
VVEEEEGCLDVSGGGGGAGDLAVEGFTAATGEQSAAEQADGEEQGAGGFGDDGAAAAAAGWVDRSARTAAAGWGLDDWWWRGDGGRWWRGGVLEGVADPIVAFDETAEEGVVVFEASRVDLVALAEVVPVGGIGHEAGDFGLFEQPGEGGVVAFEGRGVEVAAGFEAVPERGVGQLAVEGVVT